MYSSANHHRGDNAGHVGFPYPYVTCRLCFRNRYHPSPTSFARGSKGSKGIGTAFGVSTVANHDEDDASYCNPPSETDRLLSAGYVRDQQRSRAEGIVVAYGCCVALFPSDSLLRRAASLRHGLLSELAVIMLSRSV